MIGATNPGLIASLREKQKILHKALEDCIAEVSMALQAVLTVPLPENCEKLWLEIFFTHNNIRMQVLVGCAPHSAVFPEL